MFDQEVVRAFYTTELVNFNSDSNLPRAGRMGIRNVTRLLLGRVAGPNHGKNVFVQELQDAIDELAKMDEMAFVKIDSVHLGPGRIRTVWRKEAHHIQVDRLSILQAVAATAIDTFTLRVTVQLLGPENAASRRWVPECGGQDRSCSGLNWALLTAALLGDTDTIKALLKRSSNTDKQQNILNRSLELAASHGNFDAVVLLLEANADPNARTTCKGHLCGVNAFREACMAGHEKIVNLLLEPGHGVKRKGSTYEDAILKAAHGYRSEDHGHVEIVKLLLAKGEFANLARLRCNIIGEACLWGREDVLRLVLENVPSVRFHWRSWQTPMDIATARKHENIVQILLAHEATQGKGSDSSGHFRA